MNIRGISFLLLLLFFTKISAQETTSILSNAEQKLQNSGFPTFNIGKIQCITISDGFGPSTIQPSIAPLVSPAIVKEKFRESFRNDSIMDFPINVLLLKFDEKLVLIDAGQGSLTNKNAGRLVGNLQAIGIKPYQITDIIITHAHLDHIGGLINDKGNSIYKNAKIHISRVEYEFWKSVNNAEYEAIIKATNGILSVIKTQINLLEDGAIIYGCIKNEIAPGHTPGHLVNTIFSEGNELVAINDIVLDVLMISYPDWGSAFDLDFEQAKTTRKAYLKKLYDNKTLIWGSHLPYPGIGYIIKECENIYKFSPKFFSNPLP